MYEQNDRYIWAYCEALAHVAVGRAGTIVRSSYYRVCRGNISCPIRVPEVLPRYFIQISTDTQIDLFIDSPGLSIIHVLQLFRSLFDFAGMYPVEQDGSVLASESVQ